MLQSQVLTLVFCVISTVYAFIYIYSQVLTQFCVLSTLCTHLVRLVHFHLHLEYDLWMYFLR